MNSSTLTVFGTLRETLRLSAKHFRLLLAAGAVGAVPVTIQALAANLGRPDMVFISGLLSLPIFIIQMIIDGVCRAAILGVLAEPVPEFALTAMRTAIRTRTWTLFRVGILLALMVVPFGIIVGFIGAAFMHSGERSEASIVTTMITIFFSMIFLLFMKYALADPLVVVKSTRARDALKISWRMTRGHFAYVLGCYLLLGMAIVLIQTFLPNFAFDSVYEIIAAILINVFGSVIGSIWIVLSWVMYVRIVEADQFCTPPAELEQG